jgi:hypothetical protein
VFLTIAVSWLASLATQVFRIHGSASVAAATLIDAELFNPLRRWRWVQQAVDRRFNRARYDADETARVSAVLSAAISDCGITDDAIG